MPCNLAVSITRARVNEAGRLLNTETVIESLRFWAHNNGYTERRDSFHEHTYGHDTAPAKYMSIQTLPDGRVQMRLGGYFGVDIFVGADRAVTVNGTYGSMAAFCEETRASVSAVLDVLIQDAVTAQVRAALGGLGQVTEREVTVNNGGRMQQATRLTLRV